MTAAEVRAAEETRSLTAMEDKAQIQEAIKSQGEVVRKLKSEKASKEQVSIESAVVCNAGVKAGC